MKVLYRKIYGNELDNSLSGKGGPDLIFGFEGKDKLYGQGGADILYGGGGNDLLDGGTGADAMYGGSGDDLYRVDHFGDVISEDSTGAGDEGGVDTVESTIDFTLGEAFEKLALTGAGNTHGVGNNGANIIKGNDGANVLTGRGGADDLRGNAGADILIGGEGRDTLLGGADADTFVFGKADATSTDRVSDFASTEDWIGIFASDYGLSEGHGLVSGQLDPSYFTTVSGTQKQGTALGHGQFLFNTTSGALMWDADGAGTASSGVVIANFSPVASQPVTLSSSRFTIMDETPAVAAIAATPEVAEGDRAFFKVVLATPANKDVLVTYSLEAGLASGADYEGASGQAIIKAGEMSALIAIPTIDDSLAEGVESFSLRILAAELQDGTPLEVTGATAAVSIVDEPASVSSEFLTKDLGGAGQGSTDPAGLAYVPGIGLFVSDSEVDESPFSRTNNLFSVNLDGSGSRGFSLEVQNGGFTDEPTGLAYDPSTGRLYISDDDLFTIFWVDPTKSTELLGSFSVPAAADDPEDIAVDASNGHLFIVNGLSHSIVEVDPATGAQVGATIQLDGSIITDPEALVYDAQHQVFYVGGDFSNLIWKVDRSGQIIETIDVLANYPNPVTGTKVHVKDLEFAPTSDPNDDPDALALYVADYGNSHLTAQSSDDGRILELHLVDGSGWLLA